MTPRSHDISYVLAQAGPEIDLAGSGGSGGVGSTVFLGVVVLVILGAVLGGIYVFTVAKRSAGGGSGPVQGISVQTRRRIKDAIAKNDYATAGDLYARANAHSDAADAYLRAGVYLKAAGEFRSAGNRAQAIHCFKQAGEFIQAARLYAESGEHRAAAAEYVQANELALAAEQYALYGDHKRAGEYYERSGSFREAADHYSQAELPLQAAENYSRYLDALPASLAGLNEEQREIARRTGDFFLEAGLSDKASEVFQLGGFFKQAADCLRTTGDYSRAAKMLLEAGQPLLAAEVLEEGGEEQRAARMVAEALEAADELEKAAQQFARAGDPRRAAMLYEKLGRGEKAAAIYEELSEFDRAVELYEAAGKMGNAAHCAEQLGDPTRAVDLYERAGDVHGQLRMLRAQGEFFRAGRLMFELRQFEDALEVLELIDSRDPMYLRSLELQGDVLRSQGRHEKAYSRYRAALGTRAADVATISLYYKMGRALEEVQDQAGALQNYTVVTEVDAQYEDAALRLKGLRDRQRRANRTTASGLFASANLSGVDTERYEIIEEIARGGMGIVYRARDTVLGRIVAYKILSENLRENEVAVKYFLREARAAAALSHPNIVTIFDAGEQDNEFYMAMEFVEGTTLKELIRRAGALPDEQVRYIMLNCCKALQYAHSKAIVHRDIKSGNVMITRDKTLKVMDFGLAKFLREYQNNHTQQVGTPFYMSPEQIRGSNIDFRSDLYSLGCMAFECATGTVPFYKGDLSYHHIHTKPPAPRSINPVLSPHLESVILKLLEKSPDDRYQSAGKVLEDLT